MYLEAITLVISSGDSKTGFSDPRTDYMQLTLYKAWIFKLFSRFFVHTLRWSATGFDFFKDRLMRWSLIYAPSYIYPKRSICIAHFSQRLRLAVSFISIFKGHINAECGARQHCYKVAAIQNSDEVRIFTKLCDRYLLYW